MPISSDISQKGKKYSKLPTIDNENIIINEDNPSFFLCSEDKLWKNENIEMVNITEFPLIDNYITPNVKKVLKKNKKIGKIKYINVIISFNSLIKTLVL